MTIVALSRVKLAQTLITHEDTLLPFIYCLSEGPAAYTYSPGFNGRPHRGNILEPKTVAV